MNIFVLDQDPIVAAQMQCDKHVVKMPLECAQMLSAAHRALDYDTLPTDSPIYHLTHQNHPCTRWAMQAADNYRWLYEHFRGLTDEYTYRYYLEHKSWWKLSNILAKPPKNIREASLTPFAQAMPDEYKHDDAVVAYRRFYVADKRNFLKYRKRPVPQWLEESLVH